MGEPSSFQPAVCLSVGLHAGGEGGGGREHGGGNRIEGVCVCVCETVREREGERESV